MAERVELVVDPRRGERISLELPLTFRTPPSDAAKALGLDPSVDLSDPIVARGVAIVAAAAHADPPLELAVLGGVAHRMRCPSSNRPETSLRRVLHDLDLACLHKEIRGVRAFLESVHEREGSALRFFATDGDRIFNSLGEGRRFRYHMVTDQRGTQVDLGTVDLLADEFRFCHRLDLRTEVASARANRGTLSLATLLLAKLQFIQRIPEEDAGRVPGRVLESFGRHEVVIGPEGKDVQDILALLADHPIGEGVDGISPSQLTSHLRSDDGLARTVSLNLRMVANSPVLAGVPEPLRTGIRGRLGQLATLTTPLAPTKRRGLFRGPWWEEVDAQPAVDGTGTVG